MDGAMNKANEGKNGGATLVRFMHHLARRKKKKISNMKKKSRKADLKRNESLTRTLKMENASISIHDTS